MIGCAAGERGDLCLGATRPLGLRGTERAHRSLAPEQRWERYARLRPTHRAVGHSAVIGALPSVVTHDLSETVAAVCKLAEPVERSVGMRPAKRMGSWLPSRPPTSRAVPPRPSCTASCASILNPSSRTRASTTSAVSLATSRTSFAPT